MCGTLLLATMLLYMDRLTLSVTATQLKREMHLTDGALWPNRSLVQLRIRDRRHILRLHRRSNRSPPALSLCPRRLVARRPVDPAGKLADVDKTPWRSGRSGLGGIRLAAYLPNNAGTFRSGALAVRAHHRANILAESDRPLGNSILQSGASLGAVLTPILIQVARAFGAPWQLPFVAIGAVGILWVPLWTRFIGPNDIDPRTSHARVAGPASIAPFRLAVQFLMLIVVVVTISMAWQFQRAWLPKYLKEHHDYSEATANYFTSGYYIVADVGCLFFGAVVSVLTWCTMHVRFARLVSFGLCASLMALAACVPNMDRGPLLLATIALAGAGASGAHPQYYALAQELPTRHMGVLSGVLSAASWVAVGIMQSAMGNYIDRMNQTDPQHSYDLPLTIIGFAPLIGFAAMAVWVAVARRQSRVDASKVL